MRVNRLRATVGAVTAMLAVLLGLVPCALASDDIATATPASVGNVLYDSTSYTTEADENLGCSGGAAGGKSGWTRFDADSSGVLTITLASDYDAILHVYTAAATAPPALAGLNDAICGDDDHGVAGGVEARAVGIQRGQSVYIQTLGVGAAPASAAGANNLRLTFVADDGDGDRVPDGTDACPQTPGLQADGCPPAASDSDQDGVLDGNDRCVTTSGDLSNGCPSHIYGDVRGRWQTNRLLTKLVSLVVDAPVGSRISLQCSGRRGACAFARVLVPTTTRHTTNLRSYFKGRVVFPNATRLTVRVTHPQQIGIYQRLVTRRGRRLPIVTRACIASNGKVAPCS